MIRQKRFKQQLISTAIFLLILAIVPLTTKASAYNDWTGVWSTTYGNVTLSWTKQGGLSGTVGQNGHLEGNPADPWAKVIRGTWSDGEISGTFEFRMDDDMKGFQGWRNSPGNSWIGTRDIVPEPTD